MNFSACVPLLLFCSSISYWSLSVVKLERNQEPFMLPHISGWWSNKHHGNVMNVLSKVCRGSALWCLYDWAPFGVPVRQVLLTDPWQTNLIDSGLVCQLKSGVSNAASYPPSRGMNNHISIPLFLLFDILTHSCISQPSKGRKTDILMISRAILIFPPTP